MAVGANRTWVENEQGRIGATMIHDRPRNRILRLDDGRYAKIVIGSALYRAQPHGHDNFRRWTVRNWLVWRFLRRQDHPGLIRVHERVIDKWGDEGFACEPLQAHQLIDGGDPHPAVESLESFLQAGVRLASALAVLHRSRRVHCDVTPYNVLLREGKVVLIDFEAAVRIGEFSSEFPNAVRFPRTILTPACCSPEQANRLPVGPASDIYCLALTMLSWVSGKFGVNGDGVTGHEVARYLCAKGEYRHWKLIDERIYVTQVLDLFAQCLRVRPLDRPADGDAFQVALLNLLATLPPDVLARPIGSGPLPQRNAPLGVTDNETYEITLF